MTSPTFSGELLECEGFTLLELLIVIIIVGILTAIAVPQYFQVAERSRVAEAEQMLAAVRGSELRFRAANPENAYYESDDLTGSPLDVEAPVMQGWSAPFVAGYGPGADLCTIRLQGAYTGAQIMMDLDTGHLCVGGTHAFRGMNPAPVEWGIPDDATLCGGCGL